MLCPANHQKEQVLSTMAIDDTFNTCTTNDPDVYMSGSPRVKSYKSRPEVLHITVDKIEFTSDIENLYFNMVLSAHHFKKYMWFEGQIEGGESVGMDWAGINTRMNYISHRICYLKKHHKPKPCDLCVKACGLTTCEHWRT